MLTVPPFPYHHGYDELGKGTPICLPAELTADVRYRTDIGDALRATGLATLGRLGWL